MTRYLKRDEKGFTLIELLIVVAIIGILAAIAIPNLITAQRRARYSRAAGDTKSIMTQAMVVTSDYNQTPVAGLNFGPTDPSFLWTQLTPGALPQLPVYMAQVNDVWAAGIGCATGAAAEACYQFSEVPAAGGCVIGPGCVVFAVRTVGGDATTPGVVWTGLAAAGVPGDDDLGNSSVMGCQFGPTVGLSNPC